jgi:hypothetical protein
VAGEKNKASDVLAELDRQSQIKYVAAYDTAIISAGLGQLDEAFHRLELAWAEHSSWLAYLAVEPRLAALRSDPRFGQLLDRVGLT